MKGKLIETKEKRERSIIVTVNIDGVESWDAKDKEEELMRLASSCGVLIVHREIVRLKNITPSLFLGKGKIEGIALSVESNEADVVIFSEDLSPSQQKNIEEILKVKTIDRTQLILEIFASRAKSNEGKIQVELAQLTYLLPRLAGKGIELSRLGGGLGTKGPGEQKLEIDRRRIRGKIDKLKNNLEDISERRKFKRDHRNAIFPLSIALVGYTNSGKSTLFNALTASDIVAKDQLFSTLDPTVRKLSLGDSLTVLISDTVGFLNKLPHHLIESFKATLEEVVESDIIFHVIDMSDELIEKKKDAVMKVLDELGAQDKKVFTVLNKSDKIQSVMERDRIAFSFRDAIVVSALTGDGLDKIKYKISDIVKENMVKINIVVPHNNFDLVKLVREHGAIESEKYVEDGLEITAKVSVAVKNIVMSKINKKNKSSFNS